ncbi:MAG: DUF3572 domain-containing protein [Alphaproteobacteria bacterium]
MLIPKPTRAKPMGAAEAEALALRALAWIAADDERLDRFLALTGIDLATLRSRAAEPAMLGGVLECLLGDERWVTAFAADAEIDPLAVARARRLLPGGGEPAP